MTAPAFTLEPMAGRHIDAVSAIDQLVYAHPWKAAIWRNEIREADRHHIVARMTEAVVGHAGLLFVVDDAHVTTVAVHPDHQGFGIGSAMVECLLTEARNRGSVAATLEVRANDRRAQRLYARFGFRPAGSRKAYYSDPSDDAIIMWLHDLDGDEFVKRLATGEPQ